MYRVLLSLVGLIVSGVAATVFAHPARPLYEPPLLAPPASVSRVGGTTWRGSLFSTDVTVTFQADGALTYTRAAKAGKGKVGSTGSWTQQAELIQFDINKYSEFRGVIKGNVMEGEASNKAGKGGRFHLQRVDSDK